MLRTSEIAALRWVLREVVNLEQSGSRIEIRLELRVYERDLGVQGVDQLENHGSLGGLEHGAKVLTESTFGQRSHRGIAPRKEPWKQIGEGGWRRKETACHTGNADCEGHVSDFRVERATVRPLPAMVAKLLTVVGNQNHDGIVDLSRIAQGLDDLLQLSIDVRQLLPVLVA